jgi:hypothetical protein
LRLLVSELASTGKRLGAVCYEHDVLVGAKAYAEAASAVPDVVTGVIVNPACDSKRYAIEEHVARKILVSLARHDHESVVAAYPVGKYNYIPVTCVKVDVVIAAAECAERAADLLYDGFESGTVAGDNDGIRGITEGVAVFVLDATKS